jgi:hypothetical protein
MAFNLVELAHFILVIAVSKAHSEQFSSIQVCTLNLPLISMNIRIVIFTFRRYHTHFLPSGVLHVDHGLCLASYGSRFGTRNRPHSKPSPGSFSRDQIYVLGTSWHPPCVYIICSAVATIRTPKSFFIYAKRYTPLTLVGSNYANYNREVLTRTVPNHMRTGMAPCYLNT